MQESADCHIRTTGTIKKIRANKTSIRRKNSMEQRTMIQFVEVSENQIVIVFDNQGREYVITEDSLIKLVEGGKINGNKD